MRTAVTRGGAAAALLLLALLCVGSAANRLGAADPLATPLLRSRWFGYAADRHDVLRALADGHGPAAIAAAQRLVRAAPLDRLSTSLLGSARLAAGDANGADRAFRVAGQLGWRDPVTQFYWLGAALALPDAKVAVQHADALLRVGGSPPAAAALAQLEADPAARAPLLDRLVLAPGWIPAYVDALRTLDPPAATRRVALLIAARRRGMRIDPAVAAGGAQALASGRQPGLALELWSGLAGPGAMRAAGLWQQGFATLQSGSVKSPFEWHPITTAPVELGTGLAPDGQSEALRARAFGNLAEPVAWQMTRLPPGSYVAQWRAGGGEALGITVECDGSGPFTGAADTSPDGRRTLRFTIAADCATQIVRIVDAPPPTPHDEGWMTPPRIARGDD